MYCSFLSKLCLMIKYKSTYIIQKERRAIKLCPDDTNMNSPSICFSYSRHIKTQLTFLIFQLYHGKKKLHSMRY